MSAFPEVKVEVLSKGALVRVKVGKYAGRLGKISKVNESFSGDVVLDIELNGRHEVTRIYLPAGAVERIGGAS